MADGVAGGRLVDAACGGDAFAVVVGVGLWLEFECGEYVAFVALCVAGFSFAETRCACFQAVFC